MAVKHLEMAGNGTLRKRGSAANVFSRIHSWFQFSGLTITLVMMSSLLGKDVKAHVPAEMVQLLCKDVLEWRMQQGTPHHRDNGYMLRIATPNVPARNLMLEDFAPWDLKKKCIRPLQQQLRNAIKPNVVVVFQQRANNQTLADQAVLSMALE